MTDVARANAFRSACAQIATGVLVVTTSTPEGDFGTTVDAFTTLTPQPPQVLVCLARTSSTRAAIEEARVFAVNVLAADQVGLARVFATTRPGKYRRLPVAAHRGVTGVPVLDGALSALECRLTEAMLRDTHVVLIARVIRSWHDQDKAPALLFRSRLYGGFLAAAAPDGETAQPLGSRARS